MSDEIKFARDYGMAPAAPFFMVFCEECSAVHQLVEMLPTREAAEVRAASLAASMPGNNFHVLGVMSSISTSTEVVGQRFDPNRHKIVEPEPQDDPVPEFAEVDEALSPPTAPAAFAADLEDDKPF